MEKEEWETGLGVVGDQALCVCRAGGVGWGSGSWKPRASGVRGRKGLRQVGALELGGWGNLWAGELLGRKDVEKD